MPFQQKLKKRAYEQLIFHFKNWDQIHKSQGIFTFLLYNFIFEKCFKFLDTLKEPQEYDMTNISSSNGIHVLTEHFATFSYL